MKHGIKAIIFPVDDITRAKTLFGALLGTQPNMDQPFYVNYSVGGQDVGLDPNGHAQGFAGPVAYWEVADIRRSMQSLLDAGATTIQEPKDVGGGKLIASVKDAAGNAIGLMQSPA